MLAVISLHPDPATLELSLGLSPARKFWAFCPSPGGMVTFPSLPLPAFLQAQLPVPLWPPLGRSWEELVGWAGARKPLGRPLLATPILRDSGIRPDSEYLLHLLRWSVNRREGLSRAADALTAHIASLSRLKPGYTSP